MVGGVAVERGDWVIVDMNGTANREEYASGAWIYPGDSW